MKKKFNVKNISIKKLSLKKLFDNNKFVFFFSLFLAIVLWCIFVLNSNLQMDRTINDVPVKIDTSGILSHFSIIDGDNITVDVTITGNRFAISQVSKEDITITAQASAGYVTGAGTFPFNLSSRVNSPDVTVTEINPKTVYISFDTYTQKELEVQVDDSNISAEEGYIFMDSVSDISTVIVSGPSTVLELVDSAVAVIEEDEVLNETKSYIVKIKLLSKYGSEISDDDMRMLELNYAETRVTANVLKRATVKLKVDFSNQPSEYLKNPIEYSISPQYIEVAAPKDQLNITEYSVGTIDFRELSPGAEFNFELDLPDEILSVDNISSVTVKPATDNLDSVKRNITNFEVVNVPANKEVTVITKQLTDVTVIGNPDILARITSTDLTAEISWGNISETTGESVVPVKIKIGQYSDCWIFGKYEVTVRVSNKVSATS